jgi:hypothetical protein
MCFCAFFYPVHILEAQTDINKKSNASEAVLGDKKRDWQNNTLTGKLLDAIILLKSSDVNFQDSCATGIILEGGFILTSSHFIRKNCYSLSCKKLSLYSSKSFTAPPEIILSDDVFPILFDFKGHDFTLLDARNSIVAERKGLLIHDDQYNDTTQPGSPPLLSSDKIFSIAYSSCKTLTMREGIITGKDVFTLSTTIKGTKGESGGALLNEKGALIGMIDEAASSLQAFQNSIFGSLFTLRGIRFDSLIAITPEPVSKLTFNEALQNQVKLLLEESEYLRKDTTSKRLYSSSSFFELVEDLARRIFLIFAPKTEQTVSPLLNTDPYSFLPLLLKENYPTPFLFLRATKERIPFQLLAFIAALEKKGPFSNFLRQIQPEHFMEEVTAIINSSAMPNDEKILLIKKVTTILDEYLSSPYKGYEFMLFTRSIFITALGISIFFLWSLSIGYVWAKISGGFLKRIGLILCIGLLWPFSLIGFVLLQRKTILRRPKHDH